MVGEADEIETGFVAEARVPKRLAYLINTGREADAEQYAVIAGHHHQRKQGPQRIPGVNFRPTMGGSQVDRRELMNAIKRELKRTLWDDPDSRPPSDRYRSLFTQNPEPMWIYDTQTLRVLDVNDAATQVYGYTRDEFLQLTIRDLRPAEDVPKFLELTRQLPSSDRTGPWRHRLKGGAVIQVLITSHAVDFGGQAARVVMSENLTEGELDID